MSKLIVLRSLSLWKSESCNLSPRRLFTSSSKWSNSKEDFLKNDSLFKPRYSPVTLEYLEKIRQNPDIPPVPSYYFRKRPPLWLHIILCLCAVSASLVVSLMIEDNFIETYEEDMRKLKEKNSEPKNDKLA
eukprot:Sdes_comp9168_c0_seq1m640